MKTKMLSAVDRQLALAEVQLRRAATSDLEARREFDIELVAIRSELELLTAESDALPMQQLAGRFDLDAFEQQILWLCAAPWLEPRLRSWIARVNDNSIHDWVDAALCLRVLCSDRVDRLAAQRYFESNAPLFSRHLLRSIPREIAGYNPLAFALLPGEHLVQYLVGAESLSRTASRFAARVTPTVTLETVTLPVEVTGKLVPIIKGFYATKMSLDDRTQFGLAGMERSRGVGVMLIGAEGSGRTLAVKAVAGSIGRSVTIVDGRRLDQLSHAGIDAWEQLCQESEMRGEVVVVRHAEDLLKQGANLAPFIADTLSNYNVLVVFCVEESAHVEPSLQLRIVERIRLPFGFEPDHLAKVWAANMPDAADDLDYEHLSRRLRLTGGQVRVAARLANLLTASSNHHADIKMLENAALSQLGADMGHLAKMSDEQRSFADLILPKETEAQIREIVSAVKNRMRIMRDWGLKRRLKRGIGICCLFDGDPGTGKTLAAEVITSEVGLRLFRVNVSGVVDKYIGETEKNLSRIFERARPDTMVLLFDEADSLFSKRTEVSRSTDRYSNMEINVLLQLIERYEGVTILTTNLKQAIDNAFERRITFKVNFPMPEPPQRQKIWRHLLPPEMPTDGELDHEYLAELEMSGGEIKNAIIRAAYAAANSGDLLSMEQLFDAARREAASAGRLVREVFEK